MVKLRHLLLNDPETSHEYIFNYLKQHFSIAEIGTFGDDHLKNFISSIISEGERIKIDP